RAARLARLARDDEPRAASPRGVGLASARPGGVAGARPESPIPPPPSWTTKLRLPGPAPTPLDEGFDGFGASPGPSVLPPFVNLAASFSERDGDARDEVAHGVLALVAARDVALGVRGEADAVGQDGHGEVVDVVGNAVVAAVQHGAPA